MFITSILKLPVASESFFSVFIIFFSFASCREPEKQVSAADKAAADSAAVAGPQPPADFIATLKDINSKNLEDYIHPVKGFWFLKSGWMHPYYIHLRDLPILTKQENLKFGGVKVEDLPVADCTLPAPHWTKTGCFAKEENSFYKEKSWYNCELKPSEEQAVEELARTIRWTVINSREGKYYFSAINGKWYLTFVDLRLQCTAASN